MYQVKSQTQLNKIARTADCIELHHRNEWDKHDGAYLIGPRDDASKLFWPDTILLEPEAVENEENEGDSPYLKVLGVLFTFKLRNGDAKYQNLGRCEDGEFVLLKLSSCVDHTIDPDDPWGGVDPDDEDDL